MSKKQTRDLCADRAFCNREMTLASEYLPRARAAWPEAIDRAIAAEREVQRLTKENMRLRAALERVDDRKHGMIPRSQMARIAKEALDYGTTQESGE